MFKIFDETIDPDEWNFGLRNFSSFRAKAHERLSFCAQLNDIWRAHAVELCRKASMCLAISDCTGLEGIIPCNIFD